jgi:hypothetical protein
VLLPSLSLPAGSVPTAGEITQIITAINETSLHVVKTADESVTSSTTLQNDDELFLTVSANAVYEVLVHIIFDAATAGDLKMAFTGPAGATFDWYQGSLISTADATSGSMYQVAYTLSTTITTTTGAGSGTNMVARPAGRLATVSASGTFNLQWAQGTSSGTATRVRAGSFLSLTRKA